MSQSGPPPDQSPQQPPQQPPQQAPQQPPQQPPQQAPSPQGWGQPAGPPPPQAWGQPPGPASSQGWGPQPTTPYAAYGWGGPPPAPKPGVISLRPLGVGDVLEGTFSTLRRYPGATFGSAAAVVAVVSLLQVALLWPTLTVFADAPDPADTAAVQGWVESLADVSWVAVLAGLALVGLLSFALLTSLTGLLAVVVGQAVVGRPLSFGQAWSKAAPRIPRLLLTVVLVGLVVAGVWVVLALAWGLLAVLDVPGGVVAAVVLLSVLVAIPLSVYLGVRLALATPAVMLETDAGGPVGPVTAVRRSWALVSGGWWRTFGIVLLGAVIAGALAQVIVIPLNIILTAVQLDLGATLAAGIAAAAVGQVVSAPISGVILALVYVDRRIRREQLDQALARAAGVELPPTPPAPPPAQQGYAPGSDQAPSQGYGQGSGQGSGQGYGQGYGQGPQ